MDFNCVGNEAVAAVLQLLGRVADLSYLQNADFEEGISFLDDFVGSVNLPFHFVGDVIDRAFEEFPKESESSEQMEVTFAVYFPAQSRGKVSNKSILLLNIELLLHLHRLIDVILDLLHQSLRKTVILCKVMKDLPVLIDKLAIKSNLTDNLAKTADIIRKGNTAGDLYKNNPERFLRAGRSNIPKPYCQHDGSRPVIRPDVFLRPRGVIDILDRLPVSFGVILGHDVKDNRYEMCKCEVEEYYLEERPILLIMKIFHDENFYRSEFVIEIACFKDEEAD